MMNKLWLASLLLFLACGDDDPLTIGETCTRISGPACDRAIACGQGPASDRQGCIGVFIDACCRDDGLCSVKAKDKASSEALERFITACSAAFATWDCAQYNMGNAPPACTMLPAMAAPASEPMSLPPRILAPAERTKAGQIGRTLGRSLFGSR
jgi:hypothetical protein